MHWVVAGDRVEQHRHVQMCIRDRSYLTALNFLLSTLVFAVFQKYIFEKLVKKHTARIHSYQEDRHFLLKFFDAKAFIIMAVMMSSGIGLRVSGLAVSYTHLDVYKRQPLYQWALRMQ